MHWRVALLTLFLACSRTELEPRGGGSADPCAGCKSACIAQKCVAVAQVAASAAHTCVRLETGEVMCWGSNATGILGTGQTDDLPHPTPIPIPTLGNVLEIAVSDTHACARRANGVTCWGGNDSGQLGHNGGSMAPSRVPEIDDVTGIAVGPHYSCATSKGEVSCWGDDTNGQLGDRGALGSSPHPQLILVPPVSSMALGAEHACVVTVTGEVWCWGANQVGQLGLGFSDINRQLHLPTELSPLAWIDTTSAGNNVTCATGRGGVLSCWGGVTASYPTDTHGATDVIGVALTQTKSACLVENSGAVACGQLDDGSKLGGLAFAGGVVLEKDAVFVAAGNAHACALLRDGTVTCWGDNTSGQLGDGTTKSRAAPGQVSF